MLSCSKGSRGLFVPSRVIGIFTDTTISLSSRLRQRPDHYTIRAGRNLPDKEFRYLRTVCGSCSACFYLRGFSREYDFPNFWILAMISTYYQVQLGRWICLPSSTPTLFNGDFRRPAVVSLLRLHVAPCGSDGILTVSAIAIAVRLRLRTRLTPG